MSLWISPAASCAGRAARNRPRAAFVFADGEERDVAEQVVAGADDAIEPRFAQAEIVEKCPRIRRFELRDLELDLRAQRHRPGGDIVRDGAETGADAASSVEMFDSSTLSTISSGFADRNWNPRSRFTSSASQGEGAERLPALERAPELEQEFLLALQFRGRALLEVLLEAFQSSLDHDEVGEEELVLHRSHVTGRVDRPCRVRHAVVFEEPDHVHERVGVAEGGDVEQVLGARLMTGAGEVGEFDRGRGPLPRRDTSSSGDRAGHLARVIRRHWLPPCPGRAAPRRGRSSSGETTWSCPWPENR